MTSLRAATKAEWAGLQASTEERRKRYRCVVWAASPIGAADVARLERLCDVPLAQRTPVRVLHRRASLTRAKTLHALRVVAALRRGRGGRRGGRGALGAARARVLGGTYVKGAATATSAARRALAGLLGRAVDILQLDVVGLEEDEDADGGAADGAKGPPTTPAPTTPIAARARARRQRRARARAVVRSRHTTRRGDGRRRAAGRAPTLGAIGRRERAVLPRARACVPATLSDLSLRPAT